MSRNEAEEYGIQLAKFGLLVDIINIPDCEAVILSSAMFVVFLCKLCLMGVKEKIVGFHIPQPHFLTCTSKFTAIVLFLSDSMNKETTLICHYIFFFTLREIYQPPPRMEFKFNIS
jgi:hypothetical protein